MATAIEWTDETWNPVTGCTKVSPGCDHCYAERVTNRWHGPGAFDTVVLHPDRLDKPLRWRKPRTVFVNSMSDLFHDDVPDEFIASVFAVMAMCPQHTFQVLTKRHARMRSLLSSGTFDGFAGDVTRAGLDIAGLPPWFVDPDRAEPNWPLPNVWLGVSVETQKWADLRIPALLDTPAAVRFLSCEPLLGPIDLFRLYQVGSHERYVFPLGHVKYGIGWVIVGGESGPGHRPIDQEWVRAIRDACGDHVSFFFKQWGGATPKSGGKMLDGREWCEMPCRSVLTQDGPR